MKRRGFLQRLLGAAAAVPAALAAPKVVEAVEKAFPEVVEEPPVAKLDEVRWERFDDIEGYSCVIPVCTTVNIAPLHARTYFKK